MFDLCFHRNAQTKTLYPVGRQVICRAIQTAFFVLLDTYLSHFVAKSYLAASAYWEMSSASVYWENAAKFEKFPASNI